MRRDGFTYLVVNGGPEMPALEVSAPRNSRQVVIETRGGTVDASQFEGTLNAETGAGRVNLDQIAGDVVAKTAGGDVSLGRWAVMCVACLEADGFTPIPFTVRRSSRPPVGTLPSSRWMVPFAALPRLAPYISFKPVTWSSRIPPVARSRLAMRKAQ